jgi:hypothetical protein
MACLTAIFNAIAACCKAIWNCLKPFLQPIFNCIAASLAFIVKCISDCCSWFYEHILKPIGKCISFVVKYIVKVGIEFGRCVNKYIVQPFYKLLKLIYKWLIKPILRVFDYLIVKPISFVFRMIGRVFSRIWDFFDDIMIEVCYDGHEYRERKREKEEKKLKAKRKSEINEHKAQKYIKKNTTKAVPQEYIDFFGGNNDIAIQYMHSNPMPPMAYPPNINNASQNNKRNQGINTKKLENDEENFFVCPNCRLKLNILFIESHQRTCSRK